MKVTTYECWVQKWEGSEMGSKMQYTRQKLTQAKAEFCRMVNEHHEVALTDIRAKSLRCVIDSSEVRRIAKYRNVPFVCNGMRCEVGSKMGRIVGAGGGGAYLQVQYDDGDVFYFHPQGDRCRFFDEAGNEIVREAAA
ncbi:hypothetical protein H6F86_21105 [Phormidium sp. FACHB-592]|uniref:Uncharacterized protein n=1 Tax=Stenomitos frigidus AS-A4 TaxID=2933935 RepID=A0ABV0KF65_9CYAN|nr:hypothetical protein [Phormidium sp. FACHB-592]MBD2076334.1 hypothetical protein [Phormidium sp. FACHB-592]